MDPALPAVSFVVAACLLAALLSPLRAPRRTAYDAYIACWLLAANLIHGINALAPTRVGALEGWCDIVTNVLLAGNVAVLAACLCTAYGLACAAPEHKGDASASHQVERRARYVNAAICIGLPVLSTPLRKPPPLPHPIPSLIEGTACRHSRAEHAIRRSRDLRMPSEHQSLRAVHRARPRPDPLPRAARPRVRRIRASPSAHLHTAAPFLHAVCRAPHPRAPVPSRHAGPARPRAP